MKKVTIWAVLFVTAFFGLISCATGVTTGDFRAYQAEQERKIARIGGEISEIRQSKRAFVSFRRSSIP